MFWNPRAPRLGGHHAGGLCRGPAPAGMAPGIRPWGDACHACWPGGPGARCGLRWRPRRMGPPV